jgi:ABC-type glutathione transport system ATPase component
MATSHSDSDLTTKEVGSTTDASTAPKTPVRDEAAETLNEKEEASPSRTLDADGDDDASVEHTKEMQRRSSVVEALARSYSRASGVENPFLAGPNSPLNPASPNFSGKEWAKAIVDLVRQDGGSFRSAGVCFQNLNVHGFGESTDYQKDVANVWLSLAGWAKSLISSNKQRIDILRQFDGIVNKGEMLIVLGPPGSGCSTFLKTIAGEMNGIYVDDDAYFNYQGK